MAKMCECGHYYSDHRGIAECKISGCQCKQFHHLDEEHQHRHICEVCGRDYACSHNRCTPEDNIGVCNICIKDIENEYPGDLIVFLFGVVDDKVINRVRAKKLALDIKKCGIDVKALFDYWRQNNDH